MTICACFADSLEPMGGLSAIKGGLPEGLAVCFCGRHAGDQGSERTDWAGLEPPRSPGTLLFNHSAAKQSDGELHMPLVSLISLSLCLHLCLSHSASLTFLSSLLCLHAAAAHLLLLFLLLRAPHGFCCKCYTAAGLHFLILQNKVNTYGTGEVFNGVKAATGKQGRLLPAALIETRICP